MADLKISYNNPAYPDGEEIDISGVGPITNGGDLTVSEETQALYESNFGVPLVDALEGNPCIEIAGKSKKSSEDKGGEK